MNKQIYEVRDLENNLYCVISPDQFKYWEVSYILHYDGFYGCIIDGRFVPSYRRKYLDPKILWIVDGREEQQFYKITNFTGEK